jgi:hypothetical protein
MRKMKRLFLVSTAQPGGSSKKKQYLNEEQMRVQFEREIELSVHTYGRK